MPRTIKVAVLMVPIVAEAKEFVEGLGEANAAADNFGSKMGKVGKYVGAVALGTVAAGAAAATAGVVKLGSVLGNLAVEAAPLEGIGISFSTMAQRFNVSLDEMSDAVQGTIGDFELMQKANVALTGLTQDLGEEFGKQLPDLLLTARAAARSTGQSVEYMYTSLVNGIKRASPRLIDNTGLVVELGVANKKYADELGKTVENMTAEEKTLAALNAVTAKGVEMAEQFSLTQLTAAESMQRLRASVENTKNEIGLAFNPAVKAASNALNNLVHQALAPMAPLMERTVAPAATVVIEELGKMASTAVEAGKRFLSNFGQSMARAAESALSWGISIVSQLASGMIQGAVGALTAAMNFISSMLSFWLGPGSPPRVAPDLPEWGANAMEEFLRGFTMASFDVLEGVQGMLRSALDALVRAGDLGADVADRVFEGLSVRLVKALDVFQRTGQISQDLLRDMAAAGGRFGEALATLTKRQFRLARATDQVRKAEEALRNSRRAQEKAQDKLNQEIETYNEMLERGASRAALQAQRERVDAARDEMQAAEDQIDEAEKQKEAAEDRIDPLREQIRLQERLLRQMFKFTKAQEEATEAGAGGGGAGAGAGGGAGAAIPMPEAPGGAFDFPEPDFEPVSKAFEDAKEKIAKKLKDMFAPFREAYENDIKPVLNRFRKAWDRLTTMLGKFWQAIGGPQLVESIKGLIPDSLVENIGKVIGMMGALAVVFAVGAGVIFAVKIALSVLMNPITLIILGLSLLLTAWEENWFGVRDIAQNVFPWIGEKATWLYNTLKEKTQAALVPIRQWWSQHGEDVKSIAGGIWQFISGAATEYANRIKEKVDAFLSVVEAFWSAHGDAIKANVTIVWNRIKSFLGTVWANLTTLWTATWDKIKIVVDTAIANIEDFLAAFAAAFRGDWVEFGQRLRSIWDRNWKAIKKLLQTSMKAMVEVFTNSWEEIKGIVEDAGKIIKKSVDSLVEAIKGFFTDTDWAAVGQSIIDGVANGIKNAWGTLTSAAQDAAQAAWDAAMGFIGGGSPARMFVPIGKSMGEGITKGFAEQINEAERAARAAATQIGNAFNARLNAQDLASAPGLSLLAIADAKGITQNNEFNLYMQTQAERGVVERGFAIMRQRVPSAT